MTPTEADNKRWNENWKGGFSVAATAEAPPPILELPGIVATKTSLTVFDSATNQQLMAAFGQIAKMEKSVAWWLGDLGIALQERKRRELAVEATELRRRANDCSTDEDGLKTARDLRDRAEKIENRGEVEYTGELCEVYNVDSGYLRNCVSLCRSFLVSQRCDSLTVNHHRVILNGLGGPDALKKESTRTLATKWLDEASEKNWRAPELRKHVAQSRAIFHKPAIAAEVNEFAELDSADVWARCHLNDELSSEQRGYGQTRWKALWEYLQKVYA